MLSQDLTPSSVAVRQDQVGAIPCHADVARIDPRAKDDGVGLGHIGQVTPKSLSGPDLGEVI